MSEIWHALEIGPDGHVRDADAHDSTLEAVCRTDDGSLFIAWRTVNQELRAIRVRPGNCTVFADGMVTDTIIGSLRLLTNVELNSSGNSLLISADVTSLRAAADTYGTHADWFLEIVGAVGGVLLVAGVGDPSALETKSGRQLDDLLFE